MEKEIIENIKKLKVRCSALGSVMAKGKGKEISKGAKTWCREQVDKMVYDFDGFISTKQTEKGAMVEPDSIELFNEVKFTAYQKNEERKHNDWITGECDIAGDDLIVDIKSSWSIKTFPKLEDQIDSSCYEWQGRGYMMLWEKPNFELAYCLVDTPEDLIGYEDPTIHQVSHIDPLLRVTTKSFERDLSKEDEIIERVKMCREYAVEYAEKLLKKNQ